MKIGIDGSSLSIKFPCGTKRYASELISSLAKVDKINTYVIFSPVPVVIPEQQNFHIRIFPQIYFSRQIFLSKAVAEEKVDIFHYLHPYGALFFSHPKIITTIHDWRLDKIFPRDRYIKYFIQYHRNIFMRRAIIEKTRAFLCVSNYVKRELDMSLGSIHLQAGSRVVHEGVNKSIFKSSTKQRRAEYCLCMVDFSPRKNIDAILKAYDRLVKSGFPHLGLKIVVPNHFSKRMVEKKIYDAKIASPYVEILLDVTEGQLVSLYQQALCLLYPSFYEGFGLPILEAMACGCPVITSNRTATKEIAGDAAYLVDPARPALIAKAVTSLLTDRTLASHLRRYGLKYASQFSWEKTAQKTIQMYNAVYNAK